MSANVEFNITAFDGASSVFEGVSGSANECFASIETGASAAAESAEASSSEVSSSMQSVSSACSEAAESQASVASASATLGDNQAIATGGLQSNAMAMNMAVLSAASLAMGISNVENAEVTLDRAHVTLEKDQTAVTLAQQAYNKAVSDYGTNSQQASDAASKLKDAQDTLSVAQEKVSEDQRNLNNTIMMSSLQIIPGVIGAFTSLNTLFSAYPAIASAVSAATDAVGSAMDFLAANPIILVIAGVAALAVGLFEAYEHCTPFREAINEVGTVLEGGFRVALAEIEGALTFLWNDLFKPFGEFLSSIFTACISSSEVAWSGLGAVLSYLWNDVLVPVANFFKGAFVDAINFVMSPIDAFESAISKVANAVKPLTDIIGGLTGALKGLCFAHAAPAAEEFNKQVSSSIELSNSLTQKLEPLSKSLMGVSGGVGNASVNGLGGGTQHITVNPTINIGKIDRTTGLNDVINSVNQGTAQALARRF